jgi:hypothetical protein
VQIVGGIAETGSKLIERDEDGGNLVACNVPLLHGPDFAQANFAELSRKRFVLRGHASDNIDVFKTRLAIKPEVREVLAEESESFAKKKNRDQGEDDDGDQSVAAEERLDTLLDGRLGAARFRSSGNEDAGIGDAFHAKPSLAEARAVRQRL